MNWIATHIPPWVWIAIVVHLAVLGTVAYLILLERKTASWVQDRIGPNRVGLGFGIIPWLKDKHMFGLGQPLADGLKFILKEDYRPKDVDQLLFSVAPMIMITVIIVSIAALPCGGVRRATANMISYEVPLGLAVLTIVVMYGTLNLDELVAKQAWMWKGIIPAWNIFTQPVAFFMFLICIHAEANRAPFDLAEAEQELVGGYHTEYSSMRFALFFLAEYAGMITTSAVCVALFFGGWHFPGLSGPADNPGVTTSLAVCLLRAAVFFGKTLVIIFIFMWTRWSLPRFRFD